MPHIRPFVPTDASAVGSLIVTIQREEFGLPISLDAQPDLLDIEGFYRRGAGDFWVAEADGRIAGTIALLDIGDAQAALRKMFVAPGWRGREHGTAQALLDMLLAHARARGLQRIWLGTTDRFLAAHRFYEKNGFAQQPRDTLPPSFPVMAVDSRFYRLVLT